MCVGVWVCVGVGVRVGVGVHVGVGVGVCLRVREGGVLVTLRGPEVGTCEGAFSILFVLAFVDLKRLRKV